MIEYLATAVFLFLWGLYCLATKENLIKNMIGIVILLAGVNLNFILFSSKGTTANMLGQTLAITVIVIEGCVIALALAYVYAAYRKTGSLDMKELKS